MAHIKLAERQVKFVLGLLFSALVLGWAIWTLDWPTIWQTLTRVHYSWVVLAVILNFLTFLTRSIRWALLLRPQYFQFNAYFEALIIGQAMNYISPARLGDLLRAYVFGQVTGVSKAQTLGTIALEKLWDIVMLIGFTIAVSWFFPLPDWLLEPARGLLVLTVIVILGLWGVLWRRTQTLTWLTRINFRLVRGRHDRLVTFTKNALNGFGSVQDRSLILKSGVWSAITWFIGGILNYVVFLALDLSLSLVPAFLLLVVLQIGIALPSLPGRIGVFQGICVFVLALFNVPYDLAFSYSLILHLVVFLPPILLGAIFSFRLNLKFAQIS